MRLGLEISRFSEEFETVEVPELMTGETAVNKSG
jgi:hypothetical protein